VIKNTKKGNILFVLLFLFFFCVFLLVFFVFCFLFLFFGFFKLNGTLPGEGVQEGD
jgi:hypothetical protein